MEKINKFHGLQPIISWPFNGHTFPPQSTIRKSATEARILGAAPRGEHSQESKSMVSICTNGVVAYE